MDKELILVSVCILAGLVGLCWVGAYGEWKYNVWKSPCTEVVIDGEVQYRGNSHFYKTQSRGTATIYQEYETAFWFPKMTKEIISEKVSVKTISCIK